MLKRSLFIGRFSPFHLGHLSIMQKEIAKGKPLLVLVRNTDYDEYPAVVRKSMIEACMRNLGADAKVELIDDIDSVNYGRDVGYEVKEIEVDESLKKISATAIREKIKRGDVSWKEMMDPAAASVLEIHLQTAS